MEPGADSPTTPGFDPDYPSDSAGPRSAGIRLLERLASHTATRNKSLEEPRSGWDAPADPGASFKSPPATGLRRLVQATEYAILESGAAQAGVAVLSRLLPSPRIQLTRHTVKAPRLPARLNGLRILHITDLHLHPGPQAVWQIPALVASTPHDLLCYTGDFIDSDDDLARLALFLDRMPRTAPAYAVLGNHDYRPYGHANGSNDVAKLRKILNSAGVTILTNQARPLYDGGLYIAGVDDPATDRDDPNRALASVSPDACSVLLAHSPDVMLRLGEHRPDVILAGHTHGGQIRLPFLGALLTQSRLPRRLIMGLHEHEAVQLFVSRGVGYSVQDLRLGCPPEVALLVLSSTGHN